MTDRDQRKTGSTSRFRNGLPGGAVMVSHRWKIGQEGVQRGNHCCSEEISAESDGLLAYVAGRANLDRMDEARCIFFPFSLYILFVCSRLFHQTKPASSHSLLINRVCGGGRDLPTTACQTEAYCCQKMPPNSSSGSVFQPSESRQKHRAVGAQGRSTWILKRAQRRSREIWPQTRIRMSPSTGGSDNKTRSCKN